MALFDKIKEYFDRKPDLHVLFIFDKMEERMRELKEITWPEDYHFEVFDGGAFKVKHLLEHDWKALKTVLLIKDSAPATEEDKAAFPLLDVLASNIEFKNDSAELYMQEHGISYGFFDYIKRNVAKLQRKKNDELLTGLYKDLTTDILNRSIISAELNSSKLLDWKGIFLKLLPLALESNAKKRERQLLAIMGCNDAYDALEKAAGKIFGFRRPQDKPKDGQGLLLFCIKSLKYNSLCGSLTLNSGDVYKNYKKVSSLDALNAIWEVGKDDDTLVQVVKEQAADIRESYILDTYGAEADYFRLTPDLAYPIVKKLLEDRLWVAPAEVNERVHSMLNKTADKAVQNTLEFLSRLCNFYAAKASFKIAKLSTPADYLASYTGELYQLDQYYRLTLERFAEFTPENPAIEQLENAKKRMDQDYAKFCNKLTQDWIDALKKDSDPFKNMGATLQENFYQKYQKPGVKLVVIVSDAMRYELGQELVQKLLESKHHPSLEYAIAQLPTETKFCKAALLPHNALEFIENDGPNLVVDGAVLVSCPQRETQAASLVPGAKCVNYTDLDSMDMNTQRDLFKHPLVYIFHDSIDDSGHDHNAKILTRSCRDSIEDLVKLVHSLHSTMNVSNVIVTADHGFLFNDTNFTDKDKHSITENCIEKKTRYYLTKSPMNVDFITKFSLSKVSGMKNSDVYVAVPTGTNRMTAAGGYNFAHGGASLQEMVIPVVVSSYKHDDNKTKVSIAVLTTKLKMISSILKFQLLQKEAVSKEYKERSIACAIYDKDRQVSEQFSQTLNSVEAANIQERLSEIKLALNKPTSASLLKLRIYDIEDMLNPLFDGEVENDTLIEQDF